MNNIELINNLGLEDKIELLGLSKKIITALRYAHIETIGDLVEFHDKYNLKRIRNIGDNALKEIEDTILKKCNIEINKDISELEALNLSNSALNVLINKFNVSTLEELLLISLYEKDRLYKEDTCYLNSNNKHEKEIIDKVHLLGYVFECEKAKEITLDTKLYDTPIYNISRRMARMTIGELLEMSLDPKDGNSLYRIRDIGVVKAKKIIDIVHSYGFEFECEKNVVVEVDDEEEKIVEENLKVTDSVYALKYNLLLYSSLKKFNDVTTIEDLLKFSTSEFVTLGEKGLYNLNGFGKVKVKHLIEYMHLLGFVFEDEKATLEKNNTLENLFRTFDSEFVSREFYEKIELLEDFENNYFVLMFIKMASNVCVNEFNGKYTRKEIILFLTNKLIEHKKKMLNYVDFVSRKLEKNK